jgi:hypothetical protein
MILAKKIVENGGKLYPLLIDSKLTKGEGIMNPSIFVDKNDKILVNIRHVEYTLYHSELKKYCHPWGPIQYLHSEKDMNLRTNNYIGELDPEKDFTFKYYNKVDTSELDVEPIWHFVGLEDARIFSWNEKLYLSGVRRDTTTNGQGRMELSEIVQTDNNFKEVSRFRIPTTGKDDSYCEKNWMPVLDQPYHYIKWCNPTEVVKVDPITRTSETAFLGEHVPQNYDFRGGSQIIPFEDYYICLTHQCDLFNSMAGRRDARYRHRVIVWDKKWNVLSYGTPFSFLDAEVEFCCGAALYKNTLLITFGFQDNTAFLLQVPYKQIHELMAL